MVKLKFNIAHPNTWGICILSELRKDFPPHFHAYYSIGMLIRGKRELRIGSQTHSVEKFQPVIFNPGDVHSCRHISQDPCLWITCTLSAHLVCKLWGHGTAPYFANCQSKARKRNLVELLLHLADSGLQNKEIWLTEIIHSLQISEKTPVNLERFAKAFSMYEGWPGLKVLGESAGTNKYTYLRQFQNETKLTPHRFFDTLRLTQASKMLANGSNLAQCAHESGYCDQSHLNRHFAKYLGYSPGRFQEALKSIKQTGERQ